MISDQIPTDGSRLLEARKGVEGCVRDGLRGSVDSGRHLCLHVKLLCAFSRLFRLYERGLALSPPLGQAEEVVVWIGPSSPKLGWPKLWMSADGG